MKSAIEQSEAQVREARTAVEAARGAVAAAVLRSPAAGEVYSLNLVAGGYVRPGDLAARIAGAAGVAARVYVDEPELGRIRPGVTATLSADAYPDKSWTCAIERLPTEIVELGSRRVGEALCAIEAPGPELIPNLTIGVEIRTGFSANTLTLPRQAVELAGGAARVWIRDEQGTAQQRLVSLGVLGVDRVEIVSGLSEGERVLLPAAGSLKDGERVEAIP
jgi:RND family efflux transporter MFP subunit